MRTPSSRRLAALLATAALLLVAAGCSGRGRDDADGTTTTAAGGEGFTPVTVEHRFGSTEVTSRPARIVSLDQQWTDVLLALGAPPAAHLVDPSVEGEPEWRGEAIEGSTVLTATSALPMEQIFRAEPDLIVGSFTIEDESVYEDLLDIAPTIATLSDSQVDTWQDIAATAGDILGEPEAAAALVADVEGQVQAVADQLPGLAGRTFTFANYVPGDALYVLSDPDDGANALFGALGLEIAPAILEAEDQTPGRVELSLERVDLLDADLVMLLTNGADTSGIAGFDDLPAVEAGASLEMSYLEAVALNTPSPLSIPWVLEVLRPALEAAAA